MNELNLYLCLEIVRIAYEDCLNLVSYLKMSESLLKLIEQRNCRQ